MVKYALAIFPEEPRCLVSISRYMICFNLSSYMEFETKEEAENFRDKWQHHFFDLNLLTIVKVDKK